MLKLFKKAKNRKYDVTLMSVDYTMTIQRNMQEKDVLSQLALSTEPSRLVLSVDLVKKDKPEPST
jgi:hypothetical protein